MEISARLKNKAEAIVRGDNMSHPTEEIQAAQAKSALLEFVKILVNEYPLVFKKGSGKINLNPSEQCSYEVHLEIMSNQKE